MKDKKYIVVVLLLFLSSSQISIATTLGDVQTGNREERI
ncbi:hypothetical protein ES703_125552 [subsurface metagenome]